MAIPLVENCTIARNFENVKVKYSPEPPGALTRSFLKDALGPHALAAALPTAQTFYEGHDRRVCLNAASEKLWFGEAADMTATQTFYAYLTPHTTYSYYSRACSRYWPKR
jgi:hypothetical protein